MVIICLGREKTMRNLTLEYRVRPTVVVVGWLDRTTERTVEIRGMVLGGRLTASLKIRRNLLSFALRVKFPFRMLGFTPSPGQGPGGLDGIRPLLRYAPLARRLAATAMARPTQYGAYATAEFNPSR